MYVCGLEKGEPGKALFFMNNILVKTGADVDRFVNNGYTSVYIDIEDEAAHAPDEPKADAVEEVEVDSAAPAAEAPAGPEKDEAPALEDPVERSAVAFAEAQDPEDEEKKDGPVDFDEELNEARKVRDEAESMVREFLNTARLGQEIKTEKITETVSKMVNSVFRNQDALTSLARLKSFDDYTFAHSVNVCILSLTLGRHLGLSKEGIQDLGVGAILHDIGKMLVPEAILNKPGKLTDEEFDEIKKHTFFGSTVLSSTAIKEESMYVALQHHEKYDGSGYQGGLAKKDIHLYARIATVADVYDAMTSNRVYQKGMPPEEALKKMYLMRGAHFEPELVERLIKCLGIYPIGTIVELNTGEVAMVRMINHSHPLQPRVMVLTDKGTRPLPKAFEADLKDEIGRWILSSKRPEELGPALNELIA